MRTLSLLLALLVLAPAARADDFTMDLRAPVRAGYAYTGITRAPAFSLSFGADVDVARVAKGLALTLVIDTEANARPDLPDEDRLSSFGGFGAGAGLFYLTEGQVGFGIESVAWATFDSQDLVGGGLSTRFYVIPFYVPMEAAGERDGDHFSAWVRSSVSFWVMGRVDWTSDGNGATVAAGISLDVGRILFLPYFAALRKAFK